MCGGPLIPVVRIAAGATAMDATDGPASPSSSAVIADRLGLTFGTMMGRRQSRLEDWAMVTRDMSGGYRGLLLDFNGVLTSDLFEAYGAFCREVGLPEGALLGLLKDDPDGHALLQDLERGSSTQPEFEQAIGQRLGIDGTGLVERVCQHLKPEPLLLDFAERARGAGVRTGVLTNSLGLAPYNPYAPWRLAERFDVLVISEEVGMRKPDPGIFAVALDRLGVPGEACVFVDDMAHNLPPARALGMTTLHLTDPKQTVAQLERLFALSVA